MRKLNNPFLLTGYYAPEYFCDREKELHKLQEHLINERNVVLYSWRRMGKTALIRYHMARMEKDKEYESVYVDLLGTRNMAGALKQITRAVYNRYGKTSSGISSSFLRLLRNTGIELGFDPVTGAPKFSIGLRESDPPERPLEAIGGFLEERKKTVLLALDEFQQVSDYGENSGEAFFRSWMQAFPGIRFLFSGSHRHMMVSMFSEKNRPFYRSTQLLQLGPIEREPYRDFITGHFTKAGRHIESREIDAVFEWSRMQTYCIQLLCNRLFGMGGTLDHATLSTVYREILEQESTLFSGFAKLLTDLQWKVLKAVAMEEPLEFPYSKEFVNNHQLGAASSVRSAMQMLQKNEVIIEDDGKYYVHDVLLARWLQSL